MLTRAPALSAETTTPDFDLYRLSGTVFLLCWTRQAPAFGRPSISLSRAGKRLASASLTLAQTDGRERLVVVFRQAGHGDIVATFSSSDATQSTARFDLAFVHGMADAAEISSDLTPASRLALANALVGPWPTLFRLSRTASYLSFLRQLLLSFSPRPGAASAASTLVAGKVLVETSIQALVTTVKSAYRLDGSGLVRVEGKPRLGAVDRTGRRSLHLLLDDGGAAAASLLVLQTETGIVIRALPARQATPSLGRWWAGKASGHDGLRSWLVEQMAGLSEQGRMLAIEMQRRLPLAVQNVRRQDDLPSAELDLAVCTGAGLLLGGWLRDPDDALDQVLLHRGSGEPLPIMDQMDRFKAMLPAAAGAEPRLATGFAALIPDFGSGAPILQPRCELRLKSGTSLFLRPAVQPADVTTIRARALAAIPPQHLSAAMLERTLAPVLAACQVALRETRPQPRVRTWGKPPAQPTVSLVVPLYRVYEFLRVQVAAFAGDRWFADRAELIYVLDSPEHEAEVAHLLGGLHLAYGLPMQLVVMGRNGGFSAACNAGAQIARGEALALVNSDVIPTGDGWLGSLVQKLDRRSRVGAVGPKLLYDDGSLQHAGLFFQRDSKGCWLNHHYFKGMPSQYGPANVERSVPGVTGACIVLPRALFAEIGGFDDSYVIGDYEDSDLCLKIRRAGRSILYAPGVALYHLERQSISRSVDYTRGVASQHNSWLQTQRWDAEIAALMAQTQFPARSHAAPEPAILARANLRRAAAA